MICPETVYPGIIVSHLKHTFCFILLVRGLQKIYLDKPIDLLEVDIERPENNREVFLFPLKDVAAKDNKSYYQGYGIALQVDPRHIVEDISRDPFEAVIYSTNSILLSMPAYPFSFLQEDFFQLLKDSNNLFLANAFDYARHDYDDAVTNYEGEDRKTKHLLLKFPEDHELSVEPILDKDKDEDEHFLPFETLTMEANHECIDGDNQQVWIIWKVLRIDIKALKKGKMERKSKMSQIASKFQGLKVKSNSIDSNSKSNGRNCV